MRFPVFFAAFVFSLPTLLTAAAPATPPDGAALYQLNCAVCHNAAGEGIAGIFPPLAKADYLMADKERSIRIVLQGLSGPIKVNGVDYNNVMPGQLTLNDDQVAAILTYVRNSWGNQGEPVTPAEVAAERAKVAAKPERDDPYAALPPAPAGFALREIARLPANGLRLATVPGADWLIVLHERGDLYRVTLSTGVVTKLLASEAYTDTTTGKVAALGLTIDSARRLYIVTNRQTPAKPYHLNRVIIYRTAPLDATAGPIPLPKPWLQTSYPWGNNYYNHGVSHIAEGPDGFLYISSGSRTDGGETDGGVAGKSSIYWKGAETDITAAIWRVDPRSENPTIDVFARGIRNAWSFAWNDRGELFSASNGPDAHVPEELDFVERGKHYGFPYQYGEAPATDRPYPYTPPAPPGLVITPAIRNFGPAAGGSPDKPIASFNPHSSPAGMIFCGPDWPAALRGKFIMGRFGNFIGQGDFGYDLLAVDLRRNAAGVFEARMETFLYPLSRPIDFLQVGKKLYILDFTRHHGTKSGRPLTPGRILELSW